MKNPFQPKVRAGLLHRMEQDGCETFSDKVRWVEEHMPTIDDPASFVAVLVRGKSRNPVRVKGGEESWRYAKAVADAYEAAPLYQKSAEPSYRALAASIEKIFKQILSKVDVQFVPGQPYADDKEMSEKVKKTGILYISTDYNEHPFFNAEQNLKFRAVHDWFSHIATGAEFSQRGELKAYNAQAKVTTKAALPALFTEVIGQAAYATTYGDFPPQKVAILPGFDYENVGLGPAAPPLKRNPPDREYTLKLGVGSFSKAYGKPDEAAAFYKHSKGLLDRGPRGVETVTQREEDRYPGIGTNPDEIDASKVVLLAARDMLKGNKKALAYLPALEPVRIDYTDPKAPELVFAMPVYMTVKDAVKARRADAKTLELADALKKLDRDLTVAENVDDLYLIFKGSAAARAEVKPISEALTALSQAAQQLPFRVSGGGQGHDDVGLDLHHSNVALDDKGHLILLDPIVAVAMLSDIEDYWQQQGWPGGPTGGKKRRR